MLKLPWFIVSFHQKNSTNILLQLLLWGRRCQVTRMGTPATPLIQGAPVYEALFKRCRCIHTPQSSQKRFQGPPSSLLIRERKCAQLPHKWKAGAFKTTQEHFQERQQPNCLTRQQAGGRRQEPLWNQFTGNPNRTIEEEGLGQASK